MSDATLSPSSYIVLGLIDVLGPTTSYDLKRSADGSIGHFFSFSRAQLYKEPARLCGLRLLDERTEPAGRKRRVYSLTERGRMALQTWLAGPTTQPAELRDPGLLKLYFAADSPADTVSRLVADRIAEHRRQLAEYERIDAEMEGHPDCKFQRATVRMGLRYERMAIEYWTSFDTDTL